MPVLHPLQMRYSLLVRAQRWHRPIPSHRHKRIQQPPRLHILPLRNQRFCWAGGCHCRHYSAEWCCRHYSAGWCYLHWTVAGLRRHCCLVGLAAGWCCPVVDFVTVRAAAVVVWWGGRNGFGNGRCLRICRGVVAAAATAGSQCGEDCAGKEQFCGFHVVYLEVSC